MLRLACLSITTSRSSILLGRRSTTDLLSSTFFKQVNTPPVYHTTHNWQNFFESLGRSHSINSPRRFSLSVRISDSLSLFQERVDTMADARYCVEYAKTGRSACKKCKSQIKKGVSRIGKITTNPFSDDGGEMKVWYHTRCMFETLKVILVVKLINR